MMRCLSGERQDPVIGDVRKPIELFVSEAKVIRSVDGYLIAVGLLLSRLRDLYPSEQENREVLRRVLECDEVREALRPLARYLDAVGTKLLTDPRHRGIARYADMLLSTLMELEPTTEELQITRPPMVYVERYEPRVGEDSRRRVFPVVAGERLRGRSVHELSPKRTRVREVRARRAIVITLALVAALLTLFLISGNAPSTPLSSGGELTLTIPTLIPIQGIPDKVNVLDVGDLNYVRSSVYGSRFPSSVQEAVLGVWSWLSENFKHVDELDPLSSQYALYKTLSAEKNSKVKLCSGYICYPALSPSTLLLVKVGKCIDHAVFVAVTLLSVNVSPTYVIMLNEVRHAVAGIVVDGVLFIIEQGLPPIEYADYVEYLLGFSPKSLTVFELRVEYGKVFYREVRLPEVTAESYLEDRPPSDIAYEIASKVGTRLGVRISPYVKHVPRVKLSFTPYAVPLGSQQPVIPTTKLYTPLFRELWIEYLVRQLLDFILKLEGSYSYLWVEVKGDGLEVYLA